MAKGEGGIQQPTDEHFVTHRQLAEALDKFGEKFNESLHAQTADLKASLVETRTALTQSKPQGSTIAAWASVVLTVLVALIGGMFFYFNTQRSSDLAAQAEHNRLNESKFEMVMKFQLSEQERTQNNRDSDNDDIKRQYRDQQERLIEKLLDRKLDKAPNGD